MELKVEANADTPDGKQEIQEGQQNRIFGLLLQTKGWLRNLIAECSAVTTEGPLFRDARPTGGRHPRGLPIPPPRLALRAVELSLHLDPPIVYPDSA